MGYSPHDSQVRADRFKPSGKWYDTRVLEMAPYYNETFLHIAVEKAYADTSAVPLDEGWSLVVLEPYHRHSHPIMLKG